MNTYNQQNLTPDTNASRRAPLWLASAALAGMVGLGGYQAWNNHQLEERIGRLQQANMAELQAIKQATAANAAATRQTLNELNEQLQSTQTRADQAASQARKSATAVERRTMNLLQELSSQQKTQQAEIETTLGAMRQASEANAAKVGEISTEVGAVKTEVATHQTRLDAALAELRSVRGDLGVQSGLIATNARELAMLRERGERDYYEFSLGKSDKVQKVGGIALALRKTDVKRSKFNLDVIADDHKIEKKDKTLNEPVQFYVQGARQPMELVVNRIEKDRIVGYLAVPRTMQARR